MKYSVAIINSPHPADWRMDVILQQLADLGFDSFEEDDEHSEVRAYIPTELVDATLVGRVREIVSVSGSVQATRSGVGVNASRLIALEACADQNWNAVWESEHEVEELPLGVRITPHCAFGAGHHATTAMMIACLLAGHERQGGNKVDLSSVLDMGTGTGVLAIMAAKLGAQHVLAVDIDENSVRNARENAEANAVHIDVLHASNVPDGKFSLIMANIHRNILLEQLPDYADHLQQGGTLWLSGFYEQDCAPLIASAEQYGLRYNATRVNDEWRLLEFIYLVP